MQPKRMNQYPQLNISHPPICDPLFYCSRALLKKKRYFNMLHEWVVKYFERPYAKNEYPAGWESDFIPGKTLFIPAIDKERFRMNENLLQKKEQDITKATYEYCQEIARRIGYDDELILDAPQRYVAAASIMWPVVRPTYPSGRIIHSLFYSIADYKSRNAFLHKYLMKCI